MVVKLEEVKDPQAEVAKSTPETEGVELTQAEGEPTVGKTYTQKDFDKALGKGLESTNRLLSLRDKAITAKTAELEELKSTLSAQIEDLKAELGDSQDEHREALKALDDPDIKTSYTDRIVLKKREREAARQEKTATDKLYKAEKLVHSQGLEAKAKVLHEETGVPLEDLKGCETDDEMEVKALRYQVTKAIEQKPPQEQEEEKFLSGASSGSGGMPTHPTVEQMEKWTPEQFAKWAESRYK